LKVVVEFSFCFFLVGKMQLEIQEGKKERKKKRWRRRRRRRADPMGKCRLVPRMSLEAW
jgi:CelD/BcsL family acetyltransferase involved in cellulose biosynthesis